MDLLGTQKSERDHCILPIHKVYLMREQSVMICQNLNIIYLGPIYSFSVSPLKGSRLFTTQATAILSKKTATQTFH